MCIFQGDIAELSTQTRFERVLRIDRYGTVCLRRCGQHLRFRAVDPTKQFQDLVHASTYGHGTSKSIPSKSPPTRLWYAYTLYVRQTTLNIIAKMSKLITTKGRSVHLVKWKHNYIKLQAPVAHKPQRWTRYSPYF